jgi:tRNA (adenine37-N6)-methyltransferase
MACPCRRQHGVGAEAGGNPPGGGAFAQRNKRRPNRIGVSTCELTNVGRTELTVRGLDAVDGTPVLDIKPYMVEFAPRDAVGQPRWSHELISGYWSALPEPARRAQQLDP